MPDGEAIEAGIVTRSIEGAQRKVEARNFDIRKQLLEYDDVANDQRKVIYQQRNDILEAPSLMAQIASLRRSTMEDVVRTYVPAESVEEQWDLQALEKVLGEEWKVDIFLTAHGREERFGRPTKTSSSTVQKAADELFEGKVDARRRRAVHAVHADDPAAVDRPALARAPGRARLPAPGHPPARLRAEEPEAGIQARGVRAVLADARHRQDGRDAHPDERSRPVEEEGCARPRWRSRSAPSTSAT